MYNGWNPKTKNIHIETFLLQQKLFNLYLFIHTHLIPYGHENLNNHYLGNTKTSTNLQQDIKMPSLFPWETHNYHSPIKKHHAKQKNQKYYPNADLKTNIYFHISTHTHNLSPPLLSIMSIPPLHQKKGTLLHE